jgi:hypothetical protein
LGGYSLPVGEDVEELVPYEVEQLRRENATFSRRLGPDQFAGLATPVHEFPNLRPGRRVPLLPRAEQPVVEDCDLLGAKRMTDGMQEQSSRTVPASSRRVRLIFLSPEMSTNCRTTICSSFWPNDCGVESFCNH